MKDLLLGFLLGGFISTGLRAEKTGLEPPPGINFQQADAAVRESLSSKWTVGPIGGSLQKYLDLLGYLEWAPKALSPSSYLIGMRAGNFPFLVSLGVGSREVFEKFSPFERAEALELLLYSVRTTSDVTLRRARFIALRNIEGQLGDPAQLSRDLDSLSRQYDDLFAIDQYRQAGRKNVRQARPSFWSDRCELRLGSLYNTIEHYRLRMGRGVTVVYHGLIRRPLLSVGLPIALTGVYVLAMVSGTGSYSSPKDPSPTEPSAIHPPAPVSDPAPEREYWCFAAGTPVDTPKGNVAIEKLKVGDLVVSWNVKTKHFVEAKISKTFVHKKKELGLLSLENGQELWVTPNHPFLTSGGIKFKPIGEFKPGEAVLLRASGAVKGVKILSYKANQKVESVYNIEVDDLHNYIAGGVVVHNKPELVP